MATKTQKRERPTKRPRQGTLKGMEPIKAVDDAAQNYLDVMLERCKLSKEEHTLKDALIDVMKENGLKRYHMDGYGTVMVTATSNVKIKKDKKEKKPKEGGETNGDGKTE